MMKNNSKINRGLIPLIAITTGIVLPACNVDDLETTAPFSASQDEIYIRVDHGDTRKVENIPQASFSNITIEENLQQAVGYLLKIDSALDLLLINDSATYFNYDNSTVTAEVRYQSISAPMTADTGRTLSGNRDIDVAMYDFSSQPILSGETLNVDLSVQSQGSFTSSVEIPTIAELVTIANSDNLNSSSNIDINWQSVVNGDPVIISISVNACVVGSGVTAATFETWDRFDTATYRFYDEVLYQEAHADIASVQMTGQSVIDLMSTNSVELAGDIDNDIFVDGGLCQLDITSRRTITGNLDDDLSQFGRIEANANDTKRIYLNLNAAP